MKISLHNKRQRGDQNQSMSVFNVLKPLLKGPNSFKVKLNGFLFNNVSTITIRTLMKTHKGTAKRWRRTGNTFKRGIAGRKHGNIGWSHRSLKALTGRKIAHPAYSKHLKRLLPYH
nr:BAF_HP1_G0045830.mRNA.1.CDS.1 [Saccharomyces cerevisiae]